MAVDNDRAKDGGKQVPSTRHSHDPGDDEENDRASHANLHPSHPVTYLRSASEPVALIQDGK
jgi:hypothetical protein